LKVVLCGLDDKVTDTELKWRRVPSNCHDM